MGTKITKQKSANCPHISWDQYGVIKWKYFLSYWPFVRGIHWSPVDSPHKGQWRRVLMFSLIRAWTNSYANNRDAGDLRYHHAHYDVTVMWTVSSVTLQSWPSVQKNDIRYKVFRSFLIFKLILKENFGILISISLNDIMANESPLIQIMAWCLTGTKPLAETKVTKMSDALFHHWWRHKATWIWVNIGSGNGLLPDGTQAITWTNVDLWSVRSSYIHLMVISQEIHQSSMTKINMKITHLKCH